MYNITFIANDTSNNVNSTSILFFNSSLDLINPLVTGLIPVAGTTTNAGSAIDISANVTDNISVSTVYVNITLPDNTVQRISLTNVINTNKYLVSFTPTQAGNYNIKFIANDTSNNINSSETTNFTATATSTTTTTSTTSSTSSSGGGAPTSISNPTTKAYVSNVKSGDQVRFTFDGYRSYIIDVLLNVNKNLNKLRMTTVELNEVTSLKDKKVFKYYDIKLEEFSNNDILAGVTINFDVERKWLSDNNVNQKDISLYRFTDKWEPLATIFIGEDNNRIHYSAFTPGFSYFAIGEYIKLQAIEENKSTSFEITETKEQKVKPVKNLRLVIILILSVLLVCLIIFLIFRKKRH